MSLVVFTFNLVNLHTLLIFSYIFLTVKKKYQTCVIYGHYFNNALYVGLSQKASTSKYMCFIFNLIIYFFWNDCTLALIRFPIICIHMHNNLKGMVEKVVRHFNIIKFSERVHFFPLEVLVLK